MIAFGQIQLALGNNQDSIGGIVVGWFRFNVDDN